MHSPFRSCIIGKRIRSFELCAGPDRKLEQFVTWESCGIVERNQRAESKFLPARPGTKRGEGAR